MANDRPDEDLEEKAREIENRESPHTRVSEQSDTHFGGPYVSLTMCPASNFNCNNYLL